MVWQNKSRVYEDNSIRQITGSTIRPGGLSITQRALSYCSFPAEAKFLDVGCGTGATVEYLLSKQFQAVGIDPSPTLLAQGRKRNGQLPLFAGQGEQLPFNNHTMDGVWAECTLSLMQDLPQTLREVHRVLKMQGHIIVSDLYIRNYLHPDCHHLPAHCCVGGAVSEENWRKIITTAGFTIKLWEDHTKYLKELTAKLIFAYGSLENFWCQVLGNCEQAQKVQNSLKKIKIGYFLLIGQKV